MISVSGTYITPCGVGVLPFVEMYYSTNIDIYTHGRTSIPLGVICVVGTYITPSRVGVLP